MPSFPPVENGADLSPLLWGCCEDHLVNPRSHASRWRAQERQLGRGRGQWVAVISTRHLLKILKLCGPRS